MQHEARSSGEYPFDPWTGQGEYSPEDFYTRSTDEHGHSTTIRVNIPTHMGADLDQMVASNLVAAYRNRADIARDGLYHVMHLRNETIFMNADITRTLSFEGRRCRLDTLQSRALDMASLVQKHRETLRQLSGNQVMLAAALDLAADDVFEMEGPPRDEMLKLIDKYGKKSHHATPP